MTIDVGAPGVVVVAGPEHVGKTTVAISLALAASRQGRRTVVLTIDPADRVLDALGTGRAPEPRRADLPDLPGVGGELWSAVLDPEEAFDQLVREQSPSDEAAEDILSNPVYRAISASLDGALEFMTIERMLQLVSDGTYDTVVVDTPPSPRAVDLLLAPSRLVGFLGNPVYRALTVNQRALARLTGAAASVFLGTVRDLAGPAVVDDTLRFFRSLAALEPALRRRAEMVSTLLHDDATRFVVATDAHARSTAETVSFVDSLEEEGLRCDGVVVNRVVPALDPLPDDDRAVLAGADGSLGDRLAVYDELHAARGAQAGELSLLRARVGERPVVELPVLDEPIDRPGALSRLAEMVARRGCSTTGPSDEPAG